MSGQRDWCFPGAWARRCRAGRGCGLSSRPRPAFKGITIHDCRRALVSAVADAGAADVATLDRLLNHAAAATSGGVIATYQRASMLEPMRRAVAAWEGILERALGRQRVTTSCRSPRPHERRNECVVRCRGQAPMRVPVKCFTK